jgi:putative membrane protein
MLYLNLKALHIIGVVVWFAGLFYLGRLFVYHKEAEDRPEAERRVLLEQFEIMERRLYYAITWPGLCITVGFGLSVIGPWLTSGWMHAKLTFVVLLIAYHLGCGALRKQLILLAIVFLVVLKDAVSWPALLGILAGTVVLIGITVQTVMRRQRARKAQEPDRP